MTRVPHAARTPLVVDVWVIPLGRSAACRETLLRVLDPVERVRAGRFHQAVDRDRFVVARGALRFVLAEYAGCPPERLRLDAGEHDKPLLTSPDVAPDIRFNVSHSRELALCAVARGHDVGVDVEWIDRSVAAPAIAARFFSAAEVGQLSRLSEDQRIDAFFLGWTRKEAYVKGLGEGLRIATSAFDVPLSTGISNVPVHTSAAPNTDRRWTLHDLAVERGYAAALAVDAGNRSVDVCLRSFVPPQS